MAKHDDGINGNVSFLKRLGNLFGNTLMDGDVCKAKVNELMKTISDLDKSVGFLKKTIRDNDDTISDMSKTIDQQEVTISKLTTDNREKELLVANLKSKIKDIGIEKDKLKEAIATVESKLATVTNKNSATNKRLKTVEANLKTTTKLLNTANEQLKEKVGTKTKSTKTKSTKTKSTKTKSTKAGNKAAAKVTKKTSKGRRSLTCEQVIAIRRKKKSGMRVVDIAREYGVSGSTISKILMGVTYYMCTENKSKK